MKIFMLFAESAHSDCSLTIPFATRELADAKAAELVNIFISECDYYPETFGVKLPKLATPKTWKRAFKSICKIEAEHNTYDSEPYLEIQTQQLIGA